MAAEKYESAGAATVLAQVQESFLQPHLILSNHLSYRRNERAQSKAH